jgi:hypothetical protein
LLKVYANCLDTDEAVTNERIASVLGGASSSGKLGPVSDGGERPLTEFCGPDADQDGAGDLDSS